MEKGYRNGKTHIYRIRCQCILKSQEGKSVKELSHRFSRNLDTIYGWLKKWEKFGIDGLRVKKGRGRPRRLDVDNKIHVAAVKKSLRRENRRVKKIVGDLEADLDLQVGEATVRRFLKSLIIPINGIERD